MFGDASVILPDGVRPPDHWSAETLDYRGWKEAWRAYQRSIGQDPEDPR